MSLHVYTLKLTGIGTPFLFPLSGSKLEDVVCTLHRAPCQEAYVPMSVDLNPWNKEQSTWRCVTKCKDRQL